MDQGVVNTIITLTAGVFGWIMKSLWDAVRDLQQADDDLADKVSRIEVLVAGEYVTREELRAEFTRLHTKLDTIDNKLDKKADK
jgi:phage terminase large subunit